MLLRRLCAAALAAGCAGCPSPDPEPAAPCVQHTVGDAGAAIELQPIALSPSGAVLELKDGDPLPLSIPPQGGFVLYAGARARNLAACQVTMSAHLLDPATGNALSNLDQRSADLTSDAGGFAGPPHSALAYELPNIPACPDALGRGIAGQSTVLEVTLRDATGKSGTTRVLVVPRCDGTARCACVCGPDYAPGKC